MTGKAFLVGAGPGRADLITKRGLSLLRQADVILYDRLIASTLLREASPHAELIFVGKRPNHHPTPQAEINRMLQHHVGDDKQVVRLKGGDPFVMGRGGEEALALRELGLDYSFVPGVTSALAVPAYAGIPVTHKGMAQSFAVVTGYEDPTKPHDTNDWQGLARVHTLVVLMVVRRAAEVSACLIAAGKSGDTPVAVVSRGTTAEQKVILATLATVARVLEDTQLPTPAMMIFGEVAKLANEIRWFDPQADPVAGTLQLEPTLAMGDNLSGNEFSNQCDRSPHRLDDLLPGSRVYLVGAGPGDPELITVRGMKAIQQASVILHDRLVSPLLLSNVREDAELINVGKSPTRDRFSQAQIDDLLVVHGREQSKRGNIVVRLKGGDPFVYGLGGEECLALSKSEIQYEVVPGVSSVTAVLAAVGIPITHRALASGFTVLTGHGATRASISGIEWSNLPQSGTLVILMGAQKAELIAERLLATGRSPRTPVAIIESGTTPRQSVFQSTLGGFSGQPFAVKPPAVIVVGEVVSLRKQLLPGEHAHGEYVGPVWGKARKSLSGT